MKMMVARSLGSRSRKAGILAGAALATLVMASTNAFAQAPPTNCSVTGAGALGSAGAAQLGIAPGAASAALAGAIGNVNTAFLAQQGSAFVSAPANPAPDQPGGGVWARGIGGEATLKSTSTSTGTGVTAAGTVGAPDCPSRPRRFTSRPDGTGVPNGST